MFCSKLCVPVVQSLGLHKKLKFGRRAAVSGSKEKFNKAKATSAATSAVIRAFVLLKTAPNKCISPEFQGGMFVTLLKH